MLFKQDKNTNVIILMPRKLDTVLPELEVGKTYPAFDDGKISYGRLCYFKIDKAIDLDNNKKDISDEDLAMIAEEIAECNWLYDKEQHIIYKAHNVNKDGTECLEDASGVKDECYFLATYRKEWFGVGCWLDSLLDVDGSLMKKVMEED